MNLEELTTIYDLSGHTALVTGGSGVLGREMAGALLGCNANVAVLARDTKKAQEIVSHFPKSEKGRVLVVEGDVLKPESLERALATVQAKLGDVDILVNGAGGNRPDATTSVDLSFFDLPADALRQVGDLNLLGTIFPCQVFGREMAKRGAGVILNISSMNTYRPLTRTVGYAAAKAAVTNFTQWLAVHMAQNYSPHIRVNALAPGFFLTEQNRFLLTDPNTGELTARGQAIITHTPQGRFGNPEDLLGTLLWLVSPASVFVTGIVVPVDGGFTAFGGV